MKCWKTQCLLKQNHLINSNKKLKKLREEGNFIKKCNEPIHYLYTDPLNFQWCFTETRGSAKDYYYRCSTSKCQFFGMIIN